MRMKRHICALLLITTTLSAGVFTNVFTSVSAASDGAAFSESFDQFKTGELPDWDMAGFEDKVSVSENPSETNKSMVVKAKEKVSIQKQFAPITDAFILDLKLMMPSSPGQCDIYLIGNNFQAAKVLTCQNTDNATLQHTVRLEPEKWQQVIMKFSKNADAFDLLIDNASSMSENIDNAGAALLANGIRGVRLDFNGNGEEKEFYIDDVRVYNGTVVLDDYGLLPLAGKVEKKISGAVVLLVGSSKAIVNGKKKQIDENDAEVKPIIYDGRVMVPLRFIAESFGFKIDWDNITGNITINSNNINLKMTIGNKLITVNGTEKEIDVPPISENGRTLVPLRNIIEALDKNVFWDDRGLIIISDNKQLFDTSNITDLTVVDAIFTRLNNITYIRADNTVYRITKEPDGRQLSVKAVTATEDDGNLPEYTIDNNLGTRWSALGDQALTIDLGVKSQVSYVAIAWHVGNTRKAKYELEVSENGKDWEKVYSGTSSGTSLDYELIDINKAIRYIRYNGHGNEFSQWNSVAEIKVFGK